MGPSWGEDPLQTLRQSRRQEGNPESGSLSVVSELLGRGLVDPGTPRGQGVPETILKVGLEPHQAQHRAGHQANTLGQPGHGEVGKSGLGCGALHKNSPVGALLGRTTGDME
jgi:hypothetical protein